MKNRKVWLYLIAVGAIVLLSFFGKDGSTAIVTLTGLYFGANVSQKYVKDGQSNKNVD